MAKKVDQADFDKSVDSGKLLFVDFFATWCGPCQMMEPVIDEVEKNYSNNTEVEIMQVDIDKNPALAAKYSVMSVPTMIVIKNGKTTETLIGAQSKDAIIEVINKHLE